MKLLFIGGLRLPEILFLAVIILLLFGGKKIPELMKGIGQGVRSFKEGVNDISSEGKADDSTKNTTAPTKDKDEE